MLLINALHGFRRQLHGHPIPSLSWQAQSYYQAGSALHNKDQRGDRMTVVLPDRMPTRLLLRDFIQQSLYHPLSGYFNRSAPVVGTLASPINHWKVYCREEWKEMIAHWYQELNDQFLTPVELFTPFYGQILARHMMEHRKHNLGQEGHPLVVYEIGGGNGTLACDILDWLRDNRPEVYEMTSYTCVEISTRLAARQFEAVVVNGGHAGRFKIAQGDACEGNTWGKQDFTHSFILGMEVLDNLPHDKVERISGGAEWMQTAVSLDSSHVAKGGRMEDGPWVEQLEALEDPLLIRCLTATYVKPTLEQRLDKGILDKDVAQRREVGEVLWCPTGGMSLLEVLHRERPNHSLILADFDFLPEVRIPGKNAPLVAEKVGGRKVDHDTLFVPWGTADIFFPTDFDALGRIYRAAAESVWGAGRDPSMFKQSISHYHQGAVMKRYKEMARTATIGSFNPMIDDFLNMRLWFGDSQTLK